MQMTEDQLREFLEAYRADVGEQISPEEARALMHRLLAFYELVASPLPSDTLKANQTEDAGL